MANHFPATLKKVPLRCKTDLFLFHCILSSIYWWKDLLTVHFRLWMLCWIDSFSREKCQMESFISAYLQLPSRLCNAAIIGWLLYILGLLGSDLNCNQEIIRFHISNFCFWSHQLFSFPSLQAWLAITLKTFMNVSTKGKHQSLADHVLVFVSGQKFTLKCCVHMVTFVFRMVHLSNILKWSFALSKLLHHSSNQIVFG